ncbi:bifunctional uridylate/adenylate kinase [Mycoemilia scoparia]|uniref:Uridylate kinase n=1 Tax=Mycoemilia scoparia TaxID=417184 RepID=A0A9W8DV16_9FUNG|nr:bifunctional uridylate/adenylate kinase [Mycoemilia scoparia]
MFSRTVAACIKRANRSLPALRTPIAPKMYRNPSIAMPLQLQARQIQYSSKKHNSENKEEQGNAGSEKPKVRSGPTAPALMAVLSIFVAAYITLIKPALEEKKKKSQEDGGIPSDDEAAKTFPFKEKTVVFVLGGPGSGKGTNSAKLVKDFGFVHMCAGDLLRAEQKRPGSKYGELIANYIREGQIVPHEITIKLLRNMMMEHPESDRFLIDGFPRNVVQAKAFEDTVTRCEKVIYYECPENVMLERLLKRGESSGRSDDNIESIRKRFRVFTQDSYPVIENYLKDDKVITINCQKSPEDVYAQTKAEMAKIFGSK